MGLSVIMTRAHIALVVCVFALLVSACGGGERKAPSLLSFQGGTIAGRAAVEVQLDETLAEIGAIDAPVGVDEALFQQLKDELARQLRAKGVSKFASKPPTGEANAVTDLAFAPDGAGWVLAWHYRSAGDYNQDGTANISDITPLAVNYLQSAPDPNSIQGVVDGNGDGVINIADVTPLAMNFLTDCAGYQVQGANDIGGPWTADGEVTFDDAGANGRLLFNVPYTAFAYTHYRVVPVDEAGAEGIESNTAGAPPVITSVTPAEGFTGSDVAFSAVVAGAPPMSYAWNFGGGATPNESAEETPIVTLGVAGSYDASLTVTSDYGTDTHDFTLTVTAAPIPPEITSVSPTEGVAESDVTFSAAVTGTPPMSYSWDFDGGATPNTSAEEAPTVTLLAAGSYNASLTVTSAYGADTFDFTLTVFPREWVHTWGGSNYEFVNALGVDGGGNVYAAGVTASFSAGHDDAFLIKYSAGGVLQWAKAWGGGDWEGAYALGVDGGGNVYVAGYTGSFGVGGEAFLIKYGADGALQWEKAWGGVSNDDVYALGVDGDGNVYLAGCTASFGVGGEAFLIKYGADGVLQWEKTWGGGEFDRANALCVDGDGNVYVAGSTWSFGAGNGDAFLLKYDDGGVLQWEKAWGGGNRDEARALGVDGGGNVYVAGVTRSFSASMGDAFLIKYDADGSLQWEKAWGGGIKEEANALGVDGGGNVYVAGSTSSFGAGSTDAFLLKYGTDGSLQLEKTWGGADLDYATALCVDGNGMIYLGGEAPNISGSWVGANGADATPVGTDNSPHGIESNPGGTQGDPTGVVTEPHGVEDTGGGGEDALVMKIDPLLL